jgi:hypothetical protein
MTDTDIENIYKANLGVSHYAGLRGVFDAGYAIGASITINPPGVGPITPDFSLTIAAPTVIDQVIAT